MLWFDEEEPPPVVIPKPTKRPSDMTDLQRMREEAGVSQTDLADALGVSQSFLSKCERGVKHLPDKYAVPWFQALNDLRAERIRDRKLIREILRGDQ